jgi:PAS domain S-box-containing protein
MADKIRVLYVDDEEALLDVGKMFLEWTGDFSVTTAPGAREAIDLLKTERFDAIVSDYQMPGMNGIQFLKQQKAGGDITPFVILTGKGREEVVIEALNAGTDGYLQKGGEPNAQFAELSHMIKKAVESREAEVTLRDHERREADIINFLPDATFAIGTHGTVITWNRAMEEMTGVPAVDMLGKGNYEYALPFYHERRPIAIDLVLFYDPAMAATYPFLTQEKHSLVSEIYIPHFNNGSGAYLWFTASPVYDADGNIAGAIESIRDITAKKRAEQGLRIARDEYVSLLERMTDVYYRTDNEGNLIRASSSLAHALGYDDLSECLGKNIAETLYADPDERRKLLEAIYRDRAVTDYEVTLKKKDGTLLSVATSSYLYFDDAGNVLGIEGTCRDITDRKRAEDAVRESEERLDLALCSAEMGVWRWDILQDKRTFDLQTCRLLGIDPSKFRGSAEEFYAVVHPDDRERLKEALARTVDQDLLYEPSYRVIRADGSVRFITARSRLVRDAEGRPTRINGIVWDITGWKTSEQALRESENRFRALAENSSDIIRILDRDGRIVFDTAAVVRELGYPNGFTIGKSPFEFIHPDDLDTVKTDLSEVYAKTHSGIPTEFRIRRADGSYTWVESTGKNLIGVPGVDGIMTTTRFIDVRKHMEDSLHESEKRYREIMEQAADAIFLYDENGKILDVNEKACRNLGYSREELVQMSIGEIDPVAILTGKHTLWRTAINGSPITFESRHVRKDGSVFPVEVSLGPVKIVHKWVVLGIVRDITDRKRAEDALNASERRFRELADLLPQIIYETDAQGTLIYTNRIAFELFGYTEEEFRQGLTVMQMLAPVDRERAAQNFYAVISGQDNGRAVIEYLALRKDGSTFPIAIYASRIGEPDGSSGLRGIILDITARKQAEQALIESEQRYSSIFNNSDFVSLLIDPDTARIVDANAAAARYYGYPTDQLTTMGAYDLNRLPKETVIEDFFTAKTEKSRHLFSTHYCASGEPRDVEIYSGLITLHQKPLFYSIIHDVTERRQAEESVKTLRQFQESVIKNAHIWITVLDKHGVVSVWNRAAEEISGYGAEEVIGTSTIWSRMYPYKEYRRKVTEKINHVLETHTFLENFETTIRTKAGEERIIWWNTRALQDVVGIEETFIAIGRDVTRQKALTRAVQEANRKLNLLSSITRHDIINQVHALKGYLALSEHLIGDPGKLAEFIAKEQRIADTIEDQIQFTKDYECMGIKSPEWQEVTTCISRAKESLSIEGITITTDLAPREVYADPLLSRVFFNLIDNAIRYGGAHMTTIRFSSAEAERGYVITCADDGEGIPADKKEAIFTQGYFKHTGLGLFLSREILAITGITITENGVPGEGARFEITVPDGMWRKKWRE